MNTRERQDEFRRVRSDIAMYQRRAGGPVWQLSVREVSTDKGPQLHMHVVVGGFRNAESAQKVIRHLHATAFKSDVLSRIVDDFQGLQNYLSGEATQQAWWGLGKSFRRERGSHRIEGGGSRVLPSRALEAALIKAGRIRPGIKTYASRKLPKRSQGLAA